MSRDAIQFAGEFGIEELKIASPSGQVEQTYLQMS